MKTSRCATLLFCSLFICRLTAAADRPNVLFIAVDDLRVELNCYGQHYVHSPNVDRLAEQGTLFTRAYCQQTVCNPSRASLLTGLRPDTLHVWDLPTHFRTQRPDAVTLPQCFMQHGYFAQCVGKIFHNWRQDDWRGDEVSWSVPSQLHYNTHGRDRPQVEGEPPPDLAPLSSAECRDVPDNAYYDGRVADAAITALQECSRRDEPFFLAVGLWKPHSPFNAPKKYWDLYERDDVPPANPPEPPANVPEIALTGDRVDTRENADELQELRHGHLACISYMDAQIGRVLDELDRLKLRDNTIIVFWSDHGLHIGDYGLQRKCTVFEIDARVPMIIATPEHAAGQRTAALVELLDLYPTLAELCGLTPPAGLEGESLVPLLADPQSSVKDFALTQTTRPNYPQSSKQPDVMGYSLRTDRYRYNEWRDFQTGEVQARELYDEHDDPLETTNIAGHADARDTVNELAQRLETLQPKAGGSAGRTSAALERPDPVNRPESPLMLTGDWLPDDPSQIDFTKLPRIESEHALVQDVRAENGVSQHNYLVYHRGKFFLMWSDGPGKEDKVGQRVKFAVSPDGLDWTTPEFMTPIPPGSGPDSPHYGTRTDQGLRWIARGFWQRDGELYALVTLDEAGKFFGPSLALHAFRLQPDGESWQNTGVIADNTINNFPPLKLPTGEWMMSRRPHDYKQTGVHFLIGGAKINEWESFPVLGTSTELSAEEPLSWVLPDGNLVALFRDNRKSHRLYRSFSTDNGRTWSTPVKTNFPDATSKLFGFRLHDGRYVLVSNSNPAKRDPLTIAVSNDGLVFDRLAWLVGGRRVDYPHAMEHNGSLLVAFNSNKQTIEVVKLRLDALDRIEMPESVK